ncbi:MAG: hypothetical protein ACTH7Q_06340, partial [Pseudoalteromonas sp.]
FIVPVSQVIESLANTGRFTSFLPPTHLLAAALSALDKKGYIPSLMKSLVTPSKFSTCSKT